MPPSISDVSCDFAPVAAAVIAELFACTAAGGHAGGPYWISRFGCHLYEVEWGEAVGSGAKVKAEISGFRLESVR